MVIRRETEIYISEKHVLGLVALEARKFSSTLRAESSSIFQEKSGRGKRLLTALGHGFPLPDFSRKMEGDSARRVIFELFFTQSVATHSESQQTYPKEGGNLDRKSVLQINPFNSEYPVDGRKKP